MENRISEKLFRAYLVPMHSVFPPPPLKASMANLSLSATRFIPAPSSTVIHTSLHPSSSLHQSSLLLYTRRPHFTRCSPLHQAPLFIKGPPPPFYQVLAVSPDVPLAQIFQLSPMNYNRSKENMVRQATSVGLWGQGPRE